MNIQTLSEKLIASGEKFQLLKLKGDSTVRVACGYRYPSHIKNIVEQAASETGVEVELHSHIGTGVPSSMIEKMISTNGYSKFSW